MALNLLTVTGQGRKTELFATMANILSNVECVRWHVCFQYDSDTFEHLYLLQQIAQANNNTLVIHNHSPELSVAQSKARVIRELLTTDLVFNVDDDHIFPYKTLALLQYAIRQGFCKNKVITCAAVDVMNVHSYDDWSNELRYMHHLVPFVERFGIKSVAHQKWATDKTEVIRTDYISNGWIIPVRFFLFHYNNCAWSVLESMSNWKKGMRGYDCMIQEALVENKVPIYLMLGAYIEHVGMKTFDWSDNLEDHSDFYQRQVETRLALPDFPIAVDYV
jgi:hypothetical protein